jgi:hypothetical protein
VRQASSHEHFLLPARPIFTPIFGRFWPKTSTYERQQELMQWPVPGDKVLSMSPFAFHRWVVALFAPLLGFAVSVRASHLYGTVSESTGPTERFYELNQSTGSASLIGSTTVSMPFDLASDTRSGSPRIWAVDWDTNTLLTVNPSTGASTSLGPIGTSSKMRSLAFDATNATLFGVTDDRTLYTIDPDTAVPTLRGVTGVSSGFLTALGCDLSGELFAVTSSPGNQLFHIDSTTGAATLVANLSISGVTDLAARPEDGMMFACSNNPATENLYTLNTSTGAMTLVGPYGGTIFNLLGLAFSPIPEPSSVLAAVSVLTSLAYARPARRRRRKTEDGEGGRKQRRRR